MRCELSDGSPVELSLDIARDTFYKLPEFSVDLEQYTQLAGLPHIGSNGVICASDATISQPNPEKPEQCINEILDRSIRILNDGISGANYDDYAKELESYWAIESTNSGYICDVLPTSTKIVYAALSKKGKQIVPCFAASGKTAVEFAARLSSHRNHTINAFPCLLLQLSKSLSFPIPTTYRAWDKEIGRSGKRTLERYRQFLSSATKKSVYILLGVPSEFGRCIVAFQQVKTPNYHGFRINSTLHSRSLKDASYGEKKVIKYCLEDISQERLYTRGGKGRILHGTYGVIGCGSLGSHLAKALADAGSSSFLLIDNERLGVENIARHACGFDHVGENKVEAMKKLLEKENPNMRCEAIVDDANDIIDDASQILNNCDAVFITAADGPLEYHCTQALCKGTLTRPLIIMWLEAFALVAHAIVINKPQDIYIDMFDQNLSFSNPAVLNSDSFIRREAGCQSSYMPYSGLDVQNFLHRFIKAWGDDEAMKRNQNYHFIWTGCLSDAKKLNATIAPEYAQMSDYAYRVERID